MAGALTAVVLAVAGVAVSAFMPGPASPLRPTSPALAREAVADGGAWGNVDPRAYGRFVKYTSNAANRADPAVRIVSGGLYTGGCSAGMCVDDFVRGMFSVDGVKEAVDAVAIHPFRTR